MNETLKPCPFCGAPASIISYAVGGGEVCCTQCECRYGYTGTVDESIARWNKRYPNEKFATYLSEICCRKGEL